MRTRLLASMLVLLLSGADSGATAICAVYCMSSTSAASAMVHHHRMDSIFQLSLSGVSRHIHSPHRGAPCAECPPGSQYGLSQKADCADSVQIQALKVNSFSLNAPNKVAQIDVADVPDSHLSLVGDRERSLVFDTSQAVRSFSVPLRI